MAPFGDRPVERRGTSRVAPPTPRRQTVLSRKSLHFLASMSVSVAVVREDPKACPFMLPQVA